MHSLMVIRRGQVVAEGWWAPYAAPLRHTLYSMSKSFTSTAVGLAVAEGRLKVSDKVISFFPEETPSAPGAHLPAMKVQDLLTMTAGNEKEPTQAVVKSQHRVRTFLEQPVTHVPGTVFMYNSAATYMCSAIVQKLTGQPVLEYLQPRLFAPLGITEAAWETCPRGINTGGWGLSVPTEALARFGQLYLQKGKWQGRQILPAAWVEEAATAHILQTPPAKPARPTEENDWLQGYGYQFWRSRHGAYRGDGAFGQYTIVFPKEETVVVMTGESPNMQGQLDLVWEHLLPAVKDARSLPPDTASADALKTRLTTLALPPLVSAPDAKPAEGLIGPWFEMETNPLGIEKIRLARPDGRQLTFSALTAGREHTVVCGLDSWVEGETGMPGTPPRLISGGAPPPGTLFKVAASASWTPGGAVEMMWRYHETPHHDSVTCEFTGGTLRVAFVNSLAKRQAKPKDARGVLTGRPVA
jgi:CubicO group peptidase (beta-lactamase class C family)